MKNVLDFIEFALSHADPKTVPIGAKMSAKVGINGVWQYLYGTRGQLCTKKLLDRAYDTYYRMNEWTRDEFDNVTEGWIGVEHVTDCEGLLDAFLGSDVRANDNYVSYCTDKGLIAAIDRPFVIGEAVFNGSDTKKTHVGWVCGFLKDDPLVVEAKGLKYGVVVSRMSKRAWKYRGLMTKKFEYAYQPKPAPTPVDEYVFTRNLKYGCVGDDVIHLKELLIAAGYDNGITVNTKTSNRFLGSTRKCVKAFQRDNGLTIDGVAGKKTITALGGIFK